jgi:hypothetical protein
MNPVYSSEDNSYSFRQFSAKFDFRGPITNLYGLMVTRDNIADQLQHYEEKIKQARSEIPEEIIQLFDKEMLVERLKR